MEHYLAQIIILKSFVLISPASEICYQLLLQLTAIQKSNTQFRPYFLKVPKNLQNNVSVLPSVFVAERSNMIFLKFWSSY